MRTVFLILLAMLAVKTTAVTTAVGQEQCSNAYTSCVDKCVGRPTPALQDSCMATCQTQNNACFGQVFGGPGPTAIVTKEEDPEKAKAAAMAATEGEKKPAKQARPAKAERRTQAEQRRQPQERREQ